MFEKVNFYKQSRQVNHKNQRSKVEGHLPNQLQGEYYDEPFRK